MKKKYIVKKKNKHFINKNQEVRMEAYLDACGLSLQAQANTDLDEPQSLKLQHRNLLL
jgi:hypothetical protein